MTISLDLGSINGPVLVIAPHPDDETLGCGGLIASLSQKGIIVHTVFVTDGSSSHRNSASWPPARLAAERQKEAADALSRLGAGEQPRTFLALKDAAMPQPGDPVYETAMTKLLDALASLRPTHVLAPWRRDPHSDHRDAWLLIRDALGRADQDPVLLEYTIWLDELGAPEDFPVPGEVEEFSFTYPDLAEIKRSAIAAHVSQLGGLILDDPTGFFLTDETLDRLIKPTETFWRA